MSFNEIKFIDAFTVMHLSGQYTNYQPSHCVNGIHLFPFIEQFEINFKSSLVLLHIMETAFRMKKVLYIYIYIYIYVEGKQFVY